MIPQNLHHVAVSPGAGVPGLGDGDFCQAGLVAVMIGGIIRAGGEKALLLAAGPFHQAVAFIPPAVGEIDIFAILGALLVQRQGVAGLYADAALGLAKLQLKNGELLVSTENKDYSISAEEKVACNYTGDDLTIGFKASFLIEILNNIPSTEVVVELSDPTRAGIIVPLENKENEDLLMLLMPMMLSDF